eukprot:TRINITY_DN71049_c0_g1_i1.p1 TRINITY_DN71049_c0_g1~~TRINITY_DN71049_c0_g1_i1.p1  ORF type:complete len:426 (+),score=143.58 TRINITY_DN71049_c0_g1_i1:95-1279(+)
MSDSSSSREAEQWVPYHAREDWSDVVPLPQMDGERPVVAIQYSAKFQECHDYFRAVMAAGEHSQRALALTADVIACNPANYTAWKYRRDCLIAIGGDIEQELAMVQEMLGRWPKNYQIWHHRRELLNVLGQPGDEAGVVCGVLAGDAKNIHAWGHLRWVCVRFNCWEGQIEMTEALLEEDVRNNSAWSYRYFLVDTLELGLNPSVPLEDGPPSAEDAAQVRLRECRWCCERLRLAPGNEAAHNYLIGQLLPLQAGSAALLRVAAPSSVAVLRQLMGEVSSAGGSVWTRSSLAEVYAAAAEYGLSGADIGAGDVADLRGAAAALWGELVQLDPIRRRHWGHLAEQAAAPPPQPAAAAHPAAAAAASWDGAAAQAWRTPGSIPGAHAQQAAAGEFE